MKATIGYPVDAPEKQHIEVVVDNYDTWSADFTIATIALPLLRQLKTTKQGAPNVDDEDVPVELRRTEAPPQEDEYDPDAFWFQRWDYVIDEMIFAMSEVAANKPGEDVFYKYPDDFIDSEDMTYHERLTAMQFDEEGYAKYHARLQNGCRLFGKYLTCLWD
jgi:hypothetical protein